MDKFPQVLQQPPVQMEETAHIITNGRLAVTAHRGRLQVSLQIAFYLIVRLIKQRI